MTDSRKNFAVSTIATAPTPATTGTSLAVANTQGARFPTPPFNAVICPNDADPTPANAEIVRVTNRSTDTLTITRHQEATSARTILVGDRIYAGPTIQTFQDIEDLIASSIAVAQGLAPGNTLSGAGAPDPGLGSIDDFYIQTDSDPPVIYGPKTGSGWGSPITIGGGAMLSGTGVPDVSLGSVGDFYVDLGASPALIYGPKTDIWGAPVELSGPTGAGGPAGGVLGGIYPNPTFAVDMATQTELDAVEAEIGLISGVPVIGGVEPPTDNLGLDGSWWFDTASGKLYGPKTGGVWDVDNPLLMGGVAVLTGALSPTPDVGGVGDLFIKTTTSELYVKDDVDWGSPASLKGAQGDAGAGLNNRGIWDSGTSYVADDLVQHQGTSWYAVASTTNNNPLTDPGTHWKYFAQKGNTGAVGAGFFPGLVVPAAGSSPPVPTAFMANTNNTGKFAAMNPIPSDGTLDAMSVYVDTAGGNIKFLIYDCGQTTGGVYTQKFVSTPVAASVSGDWLTITGIGLAVSSGERFMFGYVPDNGTLRTGRLGLVIGSAIAGANTADLLPAEFAPTGTRVKMCGNVASATPYTYAAPAATISEANMQTYNSIPTIIGQVT